MGCEGSGDGEGHEGHFGGVLGAVADVHGGDVDVESAEGHSDFSDSAGAVFVAEDEEVEVVGRLAGGESGSADVDGEAVDFDDGGSAVFEGSDEGGGA